MARTLSAKSIASSKQYGQSSHLVYYPLGSFPWLKDEKTPSRCYCLMGTHPGTRTSLTKAHLEARRNA